MNALAPKDQNRLRVLVTDDTAIYRRAISDILLTLDDVEVVGSAFDGEDCLGKAEKLKPDFYIKKYFTALKEGYQVVDSVHRLIRFQHLNLRAPFAFREQFDIIFCRNVAIYFEKSVKIDLFRRMLPLMPKYGYLFVGVSESLLDCGPEFKALAHCKSTFYQPNLSATQSSNRSSTTLPTSAFTGRPSNFNRRTAAVETVGVTSGKAFLPTSTPPRRTNWKDK